MTLSLANVNTRMYADFFIEEYRGQRMLQDTILEVHGFRGESYTVPLIATQQLIYQNRGAFQSTIPTTDIDHTPRIITPEKFVLRTDTDKFMQADVLPTELQILARGNAEAAGRIQDQVIINAMDGNAGLTIGAGATNFTFTKLKQAVKFLQVNNVNFQAGNVWCLYEPNAFESLSNDPEVTSHDFNTTRILQDARIDTYYGVKFLSMGNRGEGGIPKAGDIRSAFVWDMNAVMGAWNREPSINSEFRIEVDSFIVVGAVGMGALVIKSEGVVQIDYDETA